MGLRDSEKLEYIRQPHITALIIIGGAVLIAAAITAYHRIGDLNRRSNLDTEAACMELIDDTDLCKFAAKSEKDQQSNYVMIGHNESSDGTKTTTTVEVESPDRMKSVTTDPSGEIDAFIVIDAVSYVKDYSDNVWAMYSDPAFEPTEVMSQDFDFTSATSEDTVEFKNNYKRVGSEECGELTCLKYEVSATDGSVSFLWFDTTEYALRRYLTASDEGTLDTEFRYEKVAISAPSPIKEVTEEEIQEYL